MKTAAEILDEGAATYRQRNAVYGDNYKNVGGAFAALFPRGVTLKTVDDHNRFHILSLMIVKLSRYANNWNKGGHADSMHDNTVYSAMLEIIDQEIKERSPGGSDTVVKSNSSESPELLKKFKCRECNAVYFWFPDKKTDCCPACNRVACWIEFDDDLNQIIADDKPKLIQINDLKATLLNLKKIYGDADPMFLYVANFLRTEYGIDVR